MMWPILTKVRYEALLGIFLSRKLWIHMGISLFLNWIIGPLVMLGVAWATLPDLPTYREGVIMVGIARCIAMVMVWNQLAGGDGEYCAILVVVNAVLQIILYSPYAVLFINVIGAAKQSQLHLHYGTTAISVLIVSRTQYMEILSNHNHVVPWHPTRRRGNHSFCGDPYVLEEILKRHIPPDLFASCSRRPPVHDHCSVRLSRTSHRP